MKKIIIFCLSIIVPCNFMLSKATPMPVEQKQSMLQQIHSFHKKFNVWKKGLTADQAAYFQSLFDEYDQSYKNYKRKQHDLFEQDLMMKFADSLQHIMDNWQSFYKNYVDARIFNEKVETWHASTSKAPGAAVQKYRKIFEKYEANPQNSTIYQQLVEQELIIKNLMPAV